MSRKNVMQDPAVKEAIEVLKKAALAVNGDDAVISLVIALDMRFGKKGVLATQFDACACTPCLERLEFALMDLLGDARRRGPAATHGQARAH